MEHPEISEKTTTEYRFTLDSWTKPVSVKEKYIVSRQFSLNGIRTG